MEESDFKLVSLLSANLRYLEEQEERLKNAPSTVEPSFAALLQGKPLPTSSSSLESLRAAAQAKTVVPAAASLGHDTLPYRVQNLVAAFRRYGHLGAQLDPLGLATPEKTPELEPHTHGLRAEELELPVSPVSVGGVSDGTTLRNVLSHVHSVYQSSIGAEVMHIDDARRRAFLLDALETRANRFRKDRAEQLHILRRLADSELLEQFLHTKYVGAKRFSLEGGQTLIPLLDGLFQKAGDDGVTQAVLGMAHRGRLNVLVNLLAKKPRLLFAEFEDIQAETVMGQGDVKYHMGYSNEFVTKTGRSLHLSLSFNPSHLEAVNPVVAGRVRAKQQRLADKNRKQVLGVLIHGDAAFAGQGLVMETLAMSGLDAYQTGGTFHVICNNQIGFTTDPSDSRSTRYCTDVAKLLDAPILHVNAHDPEAVLHAMEILFDYQRAFSRDVFLDLVCYRRYGHNESDEPSFTQPLMYQRIEQMPTVRSLYAQHLIKRNVLSLSEAESMVKQIQTYLELELAAAKTAIERPRVEAGDGVWRGYLGGMDDTVPDVDTSVPKEQLQYLSASLSSVPASFRPHAKIERMLHIRSAMGQGVQPLDFGMAELLAFGSILLEGNLVRLVGQDSRRGTFSQRHAVFTDCKTGKRWTPLAHLAPLSQTTKPGEFQVFDSLLSEAAALGFEYGFSLDCPDALVLWEAQFGDFVNGAQVILDQFVSSAEDKWRRLSGLVMLLPHGFEGQGPEHSSARFERFLQLCAEDNVQVAYPTTPAQHFHLLRRQMKRLWRKPLVVMTPKSLLRHPLATSQLSDLFAGGFQRVIADTSIPENAVTRVMLCTGKVYYDLLEERRKRGDQKTALCRIEQLYPFRASELSALLLRYAAAREYVWVQEEPANMGAQWFVAPRLSALLPASTRLRFASRAESASPATGSHKAHVLEHKKLMQDAFGEA
jgi:2-oxoglutarate dehydrogenase E1 component